MRLPEGASWWHVWLGGGLAVIGAAVVLAVFLANRPGPQGDPGPVGSPGASASPVPAATFTVIIPGGGFVIPPSSAAVSATPNASAKPSPTPKPSPTAKPSPAPSPTRPPLLCVTKICLLSL